MTAHDYARDHHARFVEQLNDFLRIPSISAEPEFAGDVQRAAAWVADDLRRIGAENVEIIATDGHPLVYADWLHAGDDAPVVLVYGHYDVQPARLEDGWATPPFEPTVKDGYLFARGSADDKGQMFAEMKAAEAVLAGGNSPVNFKFIFEGEEETSSAALKAYVPAHTDKLKCDVVLVSDTHIYAPDQPTLAYSVRGITYWDMEVTGPDRDLHSGTYGGAVHNPLQALVEILAALHNPDGSINVPGMYDDVLPVGEEERARLVGLTEASLREYTGAPQSWGEAQFSIPERTGARPTLEIHGIEGGYNVPGGQKTLIPSKARAKLSCRLVANQQPKQIYELVKRQIEALTPPTVKVTLTHLSDGEAALVDINQPAMRAAEEAYKRAWGVAPVYERGGGSLPIIPQFMNTLHAPVVMLGMGLETDRIHSTDENFSLEMFRRGIDAIIHFHQLLPQYLRQAETA